MKRIICIVIVFLLITKQQAHAILPVVDMGNTFINTLRDIKATIFESWKQFKDNFSWAQQLYDNANQIKNEIEQIQNQYQQIEQAATMLGGLDASSLGSFFSSLKTLNSQMQNLNGQLSGLADNADMVIANFEKTYPKLETMANLDPDQVKGIINSSYQAQRNNVVNGQAKVAATFAKSKLLNKMTEEYSTKNATVKGIKEVTQLGNQIALTNLQVVQDMHETLSLSLKQSADNYNNAMMLQQAMEIEAAKTFKYTPAPVTTQGAGYLHFDR